MACINNSGTVPVLSDELMMCVTSGRIDVVMEGYKAQVVGEHVFIISSSSLIGAKDSIWTYQVDLLYRLAS